MRQPRKLTDIVGYNLTAQDGEIGELEEIYFDDRQWKVRYFVVHTGSRLLGQDVLIIPSVISDIDDESKSLNVELTQKQIKDAPPVNTKLPVTKQYEQDYYNYYGWEPYWSGDFLFGPTGNIPSPPKGVPEKPGQPHLQSSQAVMGYHIHANDGDIGHVEDFILEEPGWDIRYLEVDTRNWFPGKHVLVAPSWIDQVNWQKQEVVISLKMEAIKTAPLYDPTKLISHDYQVKLFEHYGLKYKDSV